MPAPCSWSKRQRALPPAVSSTLKPPFSVIIGAGGKLVGADQSMQRYRALSVREVLCSSYCKIQSFLFDLPGKADHLLQNPVVEPPHSHWIIEVVLAVETNLLLKAVQQNRKQQPWVPLLTGREL